MKRLAFLGALLMVLSVAQSGYSRAAVVQQPNQQAKTETTAQRNPQADAVAGEFLVKFKPNAPASEKAAIVAQLGGQLAEGVPQLGVELVTVAGLHNNPDLRAAEDVLSALNQSVLVDYAEPNWIYTITDEPGNVRPSAVTPRTFIPMTVNITRFVPNDPSRGSQYAWDRIAAYDGWFYSTGNPGVVIAIVDTGIQLNHPDLAGKLVPGYDFYSNDPDASDGNGHGTHVAGTAGAMTNNAIGGAGTCPNCRLMPIRVLGNDGSGSTTSVANGIIHAANSGAQVINLSLGSPYSSSTMENAVNYAWSKGALVACAAGNSGVSDPHYPAYYTNCLAVGATDSNDDDAYYSNWGLWVDIAAPGSDIYSTWIGSSYNTINGTSMATPHVAGVAGLLRSLGLNNAQTRSRLETTADPIDGTGLWWSNGRLNLLRAVRGS